MELTRKLNWKNITICRVRANFSQTFLAGKASKQSFGFYSATAYVSGTNQHAFSKATPTVLQFVGVVTRCYGNHKLNAKLSDC